MRRCTLITGVAGTTGSQILRELLEDMKSFEDIGIGKSRRIILGCDNFFRGTPDNINEFTDNPNFNPNFQFIKCDFTEVLDIIRNTDLIVDTVYHMAAVVPTKYFYTAPELTFQENCCKTIEFFKQCLAVPSIKQFVVGSTSEVYGHIPYEYLPAKETTGSRFDSVENSTRWSYAEGKLLTEHILNKYSDQIKVCHLRFANTYGIGDLDNNHVIPYLINCVVNQEDIEVNSQPDQYFRTFLNNKDSARACIEVMRNGKSGTAYNVGSEEEISIKQLLDLVLEVAESKGISYDGTVSYSIKRPGDPKRRVLDCTRLYRTTGFKPQVSLRDGISEMFDVVIDNKRKECK